MSNRFSALGNNIEYKKKGQKMSLCLLDKYLLVGYITYITPKQRGRDQS